jgi:predicted lipoprotein with Yx(FWY)xxD motif
MFRSLLPATVLIAAFAAACTGGSGAATTAPTTRPATVAPASASPAATLAFTVSLAPAGYFVGPNGLTLYTFDKDTPGKSNCGVGQCLTNWPPLSVSSGGATSVGAGLSSGDFSTITRDDGTNQVTFHEIPLYYFAGDKAVGDTTGDGVGGVWHLATTASTLPSAAPSAAASTAASTAAVSPGASQCHDEYNVMIPCASTAATGPDVSVSTAGYLVAANGLTLYTFDKDTTPNASSCTGDCLVNWPALTIEAGEDPSLGTGLEDDDFATFTRSDDSTTQVSYYGKPLYFFIGDTAAGQTTGDGVGDVWHLAKPQ